MTDNKNDELTEQEFKFFLVKLSLVVKSKDFLKNLPRSESLLIELVRHLESFFSKTERPIPFHTNSSRAIKQFWFKPGPTKNELNIADLNDFRELLGHIYCAYKECVVFDPTAEISNDIDKIVLQLIENKEYDWSSLKKTHDHFELMILRDLVGRYRSFDDAASKVDSLNTTIMQQDVKVSSCNNILTGLERRISELKSGIAFVELTKAFIALRRKKGLQWRITFAICILIFATLLGIPTYLHFGDALQVYDFVQSNDGTVKAEFNWFKYAYHVWPFVAVEFFLIYGFRIVYSNLKSTDAQITQLEIRIALCQFIDGYKTFVNNSHDKQPIEKFESLVFSGLTMDASDIPTTFDGLDQVSKIVAAFKSSKS
ncbi:hypothetical protein KDM87_12875 [Undibacterium sp. FT147W]|uniref:Uncharacterized protein n=1 Tax=Undibacterium rivi TaxID=2828729 RepID=A0ABS5H3V3_9BURK|nr:hypothetical protein [Undibacterium rivi]MBR7793493.1 hypothetical protein [Undibacterium rivi]